MAKEVDWIKCRDNVWCGFREVDLETVSEGEGVYVIWKEWPSQNQVLYVGQGEVKDRIGSHRRDHRFGPFRSAYVTWAYVSSETDRDGIERYLADILRPEIGEQHPDVDPIAVNRPF